MATSRKKQDEKNLKTLRELAALPQNKYCFDCNQRGPTYVNVTIGSFVCTKCSGMLRGLTPPHRVKSISMATFTSEELDLLRNEGNEYCRKVWLGLHEGMFPKSTNDELSIRDFMVEKYERRRYYLDPSKTDVSSPATTNDSKPAKINGNAVNSTQTQWNRSESSRKNNNISNIYNNSGGFAVDFEKADIFSTTNTVVNGNSATVSHNGFANFENNPVFNNAGTTTSSGTDEDFSIFDVCFTESYGPVLNQVPLFPKCNPYNWSILTSGNLNNTNNAWNNTSLQSNSSSINSTLNASTEDKYAALKDLDNEFKSQKGNLEWSSATGSNGSLYSSPTHTESVYSSPSPQGSIFGSPSQGPTFLQDNTKSVSNPFNNGNNNWGNMNGLQTTQPAFINPFQINVKMTVPVNGRPVSDNFAPNPFKVGTSTINSNNPFL